MTFAYRHVGGEPATCDTVEITDGSGSLTIPAVSDSAAGAHKDGQCKSPHWCYSWLLSVKI